MMRINPLNVLNLLLAYFQTLNIPNSESNRKEIQLFEKVKQILIDATDGFHEFDMIVEDTLYFQEEFKDHDAKIVEDEVQHHFPDDIEAPTNQCTEDDDKKTYEYKKNAVEYWRSGKKKKLKY